MKRAIILLLCLALPLSLAACGSSSASKEAAIPMGSPGPTAPVQTIETVPSAAPPSDETTVPVPAIAAEEGGGDPEAVDVDLTQLSSTMVYSEVYAMVYEPEKYYGKTVKMQGLFATQEYNGERLYACLVQDATACCAQGVEFEMAEELFYPDDYPEPGAEITVIGTFDSYKEEVDGNTYVYLVLRNSRLV